MCVGRLFLHVIQKQLMGKHVSRPDLPPSPILFFSRITLVLRHSTYQSYEYNNNNDIKEKNLMGQTLSNTDSTLLRNLILTYNEMN